MDIVSAVKGLVPVNGVAKRGGGGAGGAPAEGARGKPRIEREMGFFRRLFRILKAGGGGNPERGLHFPRNLPDGEVFRRRGAEIECRRQLVAVRSREF